MTTVQMLTSRLRLQSPGVFAHWCPACMSAHTLVIDSIQCDGRRLGFDGDVNRPSFEPHIQHVVGDRVCKYLIRGGRITFHADSTHDLAGQEYELPHFPLT